MTLPLRVRLTFVFALLFGVLLVPFLSFVHLYLSSWLNVQLREEVRHDLSQIMVVFGENTDWKPAAEELYREEADEFEIQIRILDLAGKPIFHSYGLDKAPYRFTDGAAVPSVKPEEWVTGEIGGIPHTVLRSSFNFAGQGYFCEIWKSQAKVIAIERQLLFIMAGGAPAILALALLAGYLFARNALAPVDHLRDRADRIGDDLSARLPLPPRKDELRRLAATLNGLLTRIETSFESMKRFTADASHELRIPLTNLRGVIEVNLSRTRSVQEHEEDMRDALEEVQRLERLISDLLLLARVDAKKLALERETTAIRPFLSEILEDARRLDTDGKRQIVVQGSPDGEAVFDQSRVRQVLLILLENAIKHTPPQGQIGIRAEMRSGELEFSVSDSGEGIPVEEQEKIFERFYRIDKARTREEGGAGLGLAIARAIAEGHGGRLVVESQIGRGSVFRLFLPLRTFNPHLTSV